MATKEEKILQKQIKKAENEQVRQLKDAQKAEIKFLKAEGASKNEINAEKSANKLEYNNAKGIVKTDGFQTLPQKNEQGFIISDVGTYQDTYAAAIQPKIQQALGLLSELNIPQSSTRSTDDATIQTGMSLNNAYALSAARASGQPITAELLKDQYGSYVSGANRQAKIFNAVDRFASDDAITASDFTKKLKPVKGQENLFTSKIGGGTTGVFQYNPETDTYKYLSATPVKVTEEGGGFLGGIGGQLLVGIAGGLLLGPTASLLATGSTTGAATLGSTIAAGGLLGAAGSALTGGNILTGALTGGLGGGAMFGIGQAGGLGNVIKSAGVNLPTNVTNALNYLVSGVGAPTAQNAQLAADTLTAVGIPTSADDIITSVARESAEAGFPAGQNLLDAIPEGTGFRLTPNQMAGLDQYIPAPTGAGTIPATQVTPGTMGGIGFNPNAGGIGFQVNPATFMPTPTGAGTLPAPTGVNVNLDRYMPPPIGANMTPMGSGDFPRQPSILDDIASGAKNLADEAYQAIKNNPLEALAIAGAIGGGGVGTTTGTVGKPPVLAPDIDLSKPGQFGPGINVPGGFDYNAFMNLYRRGGLGAGQYLGYDLSRMIGDIPLTNLLGTPILPGVTNGQAAASQTSLV